MENKSLKKYFWYLLAGFGAVFVLGLVGLSIWLEKTQGSSAEELIYTERLKNEKDRVETLTNTENGIISTSTNGRLVISGESGEDNRIINSGDPIMRIVVFRNRLVMSTRDRGDVLIYSSDLKTSEKVFTFPEGSVNCLSVSKQGKILAGDFMGRLMIYDDATKQVLNTWGEDTYHGACGFVGEDIIILNRENRILYSKSPYTTLSGAAELDDAESLDSGRVSPNGRFLIARNTTVNGNADSFVIYDLKDFKAVNQIPASSEELDWGYSPDGKKFLTGNGSIWKLIDVATGSYKSFNFAGSFTAGVFTGDDTIALAETNGELRIMDVNQE